MGERLRNSVLNVNSEEIDSLRSELNTNNRLHVVELDGRNIGSWNDYISEIQAKFRFPTPCNDNVDRYLDWIRDLDWLGKDGYVLIINQFDQFVRANPNLRHEIISDLEQTVLPFWEEEVTRVVVGGKAKPFTVYLVSDSTSKLSGSDIQLINPWRRHLSNDWKLYAMVVMLIFVCAAIFVGLVWILHRAAMYPLTIK